MSAIGDKRRGVGKALSLTNGVHGIREADCYISWPGMYQEEWNNIVGWVDIFSHLRPLQASFSTSCIFLPDGDANYGRHSPNTYDNDGCCWCRKLYGEPKEWGCKWFEKWQRQLRKAIALGQNLIVVYKEGEAGQGDETPWCDFPIGYKTDAEGLGGSQRGEVAFATELLRGQNFKKVDIRQARFRLHIVLCEHFGGLLHGNGGCRLFRTAVQHCSSAQLGVREFARSGAPFAHEDAQALGEALCHLGALKQLTLNFVDQEKARGGLRALLARCASMTKPWAGSRETKRKVWGNALAASVGKLSGLTALKLSKLEFDEAAGQRLAESIAKLPQLESLHLRNLRFGEAAGRQLARSVAELPALAELYLESLDWGEEAAQQLTESIAGLPALASLSLHSLPFDEAAGGQLAKSIPAMPALRSLSLRSLQLGEAAGRRLAACIAEQPALTDLRLESLDFGEDAGEHLAESMAKLPGLLGVRLKKLGVGKAGKVKIQGALRDRNICKYISED